MQPSKVFLSAFPPETTPQHHYCAQAGGSTEAEARTTKPDADQSPRTRRKTSLQPLPAAKSLSKYHQKRSAQVITMDKESAPPIPSASPPAENPSLLELLQHQRAAGPAPLPDLLVSPPVAQQPLLVPTCFRSDAGCDDEPPHCEPSISREQLISVIEEALQIATASDHRNQSNDDAASANPMTSGTSWPASNDRCGRNRHGQQDNLPSSTQ